MSRLTVTVIIGAIAVASVPAVHGKGYVDAVRKGNEAYTKGDYKTALEQYHVAEADLPESPELEYNMGGALYQQEAYEEATEKFSNALNSTDIQTTAKAQYNLGNAFYRSGDYMKAIESYKKALDITPDDMDAKFNLELARKMLKEQTKPQQQNQKNQNQQQKKQDQQQQKQGQQQNQQQNNDQQQQEKQDQTQQQDGQQQQEIQEGKKMSKEDAERILNSIRDDEKDTQRQIKRDVSPSDYNGKDW